MSGSPHGVLGGVNVFAAFAVTGLGAGAWAAIATEAVINPTKAATIDTRIVIPLYSARSGH
jgi:hypothetical protein